MSRRLLVELPVLSGSAQDFSGAAERLRSGFVALDESVRGLVGGSWSGDASAEYHKVWQQWHEGADAVVSGFARFAEAMGKTAKAFQEAEGAGDRSRDM
ncbi:WXG100 family type VII secretion target [Mycobacterium sp. pUA109]|uniref:WXG100 family type VII secretion target n=1 Tax=Mycobacterium sp. pUA109 TaxID=3238982 RepID=UPI00351B57FB